MQVLRQNHFLQKFSRLTGFNYYQVKNLKITYNHETRFAMNKLCQFLATILEGIKISQNGYSENSIPKLASLCDCKSLM